MKELAGLGEAQAGAGEGALPVLPSGTSQWSGKEQVCRVGRGCAAARSQKAFSRNDVDNLYYV